MLDFIEFENYINLIIEYLDRDEKISELMNTEGFTNYSGELVIAIIRLLETIMEDTESNWIQYWIWDCDFGESLKDPKVWDEYSAPIPFETCEDLYHFLVRNLNATSNP